MKHRTPPKPPSYDTAKKGTCRWCGQPIFKKDGKTVNTRSSWHPSCVKDYKMIFWPAVTRRAVWARDKGKCSSCGVISAKKGGHWHMDHIKPLIESNGNLEYWKMGNLQTLCKSCHHKKTGEEATQRAEERKKAKALKEQPEPLKKSRTSKKSSAS